MKLFISEERIKEAYKFFDDYESDEFCFLLAISDSHVKIKDGDTELTLAY